MKLKSLTTETSDEIGKAIGTAVGTILTVLIADGLNKFFGNGK